MTVGNKELCFLTEIYKCYHESLFQLIKIIFYKANELSIDMFIEVFQSDESQLLVLFKTWQGQHTHSP